MSSSSIADSTDDFLARARARIGTSLRGKYRIDRILGVGGMAVVYAATHRNQAEFAIKMLHPELSIRNEVRTRFLREGYVANTVKHTGAVAVVDDDVSEDGAAFIVMEMLHGATVEDLSRRNGGRLPLPAVLAIGHQLLDVLGAAHSKGIVHRDIKPANIFVTRDGTLKVLDFGIARLRDAASSMATGTGMMLGTPAFMAPEQALAKASEIDHQTDLWAVGATLFWMLSGELVHEGENAPQLLIQAATAQARRVGALVTDLPSDIGSIIDHALAFNKPERWAEASAMQEAIRVAFVSHFGSLSDRAILAQLVASVGGAPAPSQLLSSTPLSTPGPSRTPAGAVSADRVSAAPLSSAGENRAPAMSSSVGRSSGAGPTATTAEPVATETAALPLPKRSRTGPALILVAAGLLLAAGVAFSMRGSTPPAGAGAAREPQPTPVVETVPVAPTPAPVVSVPRVPSVSVVELVPAATPSSNLPQAPSPARETRRAPPPKGEGATANAGAAHPVTAPAVAPSVVQGSPPATAPTTKPGCDPNYFFDSEGTKHFKPECF